MNISKEFNFYNTVWSRLSLDVFDPVCCVEVKVREGPTGCVTRACVVGHVFVVQFGGWDGVVC